MRETREPSDERLGPPDKRFKDFRLKNIVPMVGYGKLVLDIGSEAGEIAKALGNENELVMSDISHNALELSKGMRVCLDANRGLPFADSTFDAITAFELVEHLHDFLNFFSEALRILKPKGEIFMTTPNFLNIKNRLQMMRGSLPHFRPNYHISPFTFRNIIRFMEDAGFSIQESRAITKNRFHKRLKSIGGGIFIIARKD